MEILVRISIFVALIKISICDPTTISCSKPSRNDLRITGGICLNPGKDNCIGVDTKGIPTNKLYRKLGRTVSDVKRNNWKKWNWSTGCENNGLYSGYQWMDPSEPLSVVLLFDIQETIAGIQFWMPYNEALMPGQNFQYHKQSMIRNATVSGIQYYYITVYFMDPNFICNRGRSVEDLRRDGTITSLFVQQGPSPKHSKRISMSAQRAFQEGWEETNCQKSIGIHSFYNQRTWEYDGCSTFQPLYLLFDHQGELNGIGFLVVGRASAPSFERPSLKTAGESNCATSTPKCLQYINDRFGISLLNVFFTEHPYDFKCPENPLPGISSTGSINAATHFIDYFRNIDPYGVSASSSLKTDLPVCVVGGGMSGFGVTAELEKKGYRVEIFEKSSRLGGKVFTYREGKDLQVEMCPLLISPKSTRLGKFINDFNLTRDYFNEKDRKGYAFESMIPIDFPKPVTAEKIFQEVERYVKLIEKYEDDLQYGYQNTSEDLFVSIYDWLKINNFDSDMGKIIALLITIQGYGALEDIPAIYVLQLLDKYKIQTSFNRNAETFFVIAEGLDYLVEKIAGTLKAKMHLNHEVSHISRKNDHQIISFKNGEEQKRCSKVILAFPPLLNNIKNIMTLTDEETDIFSQVKINKYTSAAHQIPAWNSTVYVEAFTCKNPNHSLVMARPEGTGEPVAFLRQDHGAMKNVYSSYSWIRGSFDSKASESDLDLINTKLNAVLMRIDRNARTFYQENSEYFPHVTTGALKEGFYRRFDKLQGSTGVYYATTLLTFEIMEKALEMGETLVKKYF